MLLKFINNETVHTAQKMKFSIKDFFSKCDQIQETANSVTFTKKTLNEKLYFFVQCH